MNSSEYSGGCLASQPHQQGRGYLGFPAGEEQGGRRQDSHGNL